MTPATRRGPAEDRSHPERLAAALIDCLGLEDAIHACQANGWDGVLDHLLAYRMHPETASRQSGRGRRVGWRAPRALTNLGL